MGENKSTKSRLTFRPSDETRRRIEQWYRADNCNSLNDFIEKAVNNYIDRLEMDLKTLSTIIGHVSAKTTLNIYTHITSEMQENAAASIDRGIAKAEVTANSETRALNAPQKFEPQKAPRRRPGTGYVKQIKDNLWEGRYSPIYPDGKRYPRNVYAHSEEECEALLKEVIREVNIELAEARKQAKAS